MNKYIRADKAIKAIMDMEDCYNGFSDTYDKARIISALEEVPGETVQPVRFGRWEQHEDAYGFFDTIPVCSGCTTKYRETSAYCPHCGAKMEEENEKSGKGEQKAKDKECR